MLRIRNISLLPGEDSTKKLKKAAAGKLGVPAGEIEALRIVRRSIDARKKERVSLLYTVDVEVPGEDALLTSTLRDVSAASEETYSLPIPARLPAERPVIAGFGPAGMFLALALAEAGLRPIVLERGESVETRTEKVRRFREKGQLDPECNVQFGEGGAGTFSDGKLNTGISGSEVDYILRRFVEFGAQERIRYDAAPHVGTDVLKNVVKNLRERVLAKGGEVRFGTKLAGLIQHDGRIRGVVTESASGQEELPCEALFLAVGHSARDTMEMLLRSGAALEPKPFSMGVRIEHLQKDIDRAQYGRFAGHPALGAAPYKLAVHLPDGTGVYTFCMCPGGYVMAAASEAGGVVTNGMSYSGRAGENANSALLVTVNPEQFPEKGPLGGIVWQRELERAAFRFSGEGYHAPAQRVGDFLDGVASAAAGKVKPSYLPGVRYGDLHEVLPSAITAPMAAALPLLEKRLRGFADRDAMLTGPETRSSSPVRILRDDGLQAVGIRGLYPCGEGAGWAGGIVSAAADGLKCAAAYLRSL